MKQNLQVHAMLVSPLLHPWQRPTCNVITEFSDQQIAFQQTDQVLSLHMCDQFNKTKACDIAN